MNIKAVFIFFLFIYSISAISQHTTDTTSIIFPLKGKPIKNCQIIEVTKGNLISYSLGNDTLDVLARAYIKNEELISVFFNKGAMQDEFVSHKNYQNDPNLSHKENRDYFYHENLYKKYKGKSKIGVPFLIAGTVTVGIGGLIYYNEVVNLSDDGIENDYSYVYALAFMGTASLVTGSVIIGINTATAHEHKKEMQRIKSRKISLNWGMQNNGIGISLKF